MYPLYQRLNIPDHQNEENLKIVTENNINEGNRLVPKFSIKDSALESEIIIPKNAFYNLRYSLTSQIKRQSNEIKFELSILSDVNNKTETTNQTCFTNNALQCSICAISFHDLESFTNHTLQFGCSSYHKILKTEKYLDGQLRRGNSITGPVVNFLVEPQAKSGGELACNMVPKSMKISLIEQEIIVPKETSYNFDFPLTNQIKFFLDEAKQERSLIPDSQNVDSHQKDLNQNAFSGLQCNICLRNFFGETTFREHLVYYSENQYSCSVYQNMLRTEKYIDGHLHPVVLLPANSDEKHLCNSVERLPGNCVEKLSGNSIEKFIGNCVEKHFGDSDEKLLGNCVEKLFGNYVVNLPDNCVENLPGYSVGKLSCNIVEQLSGNSVVKLPGNCVENLSGNSVENLLGYSAVKISCNFVEIFPDNSVEKLPANSVENLPANSVENFHDNSIGKCAGNFVEKSPVNSSNYIPNEDVENLGKIYAVEQVNSAHFIPDDKLVSRYSDKHASTSLLKKDDLSIKGMKLILSDCPKFSDRLCDIREYQRVRTGSPNKQRLIKYKPDISVMNNNLQTHTNENLEPKNWNTNQKVHCKKKMHLIPKISNIEQKSVFSSNESENAKPNKKSKTNRIQSVSIKQSSSSQHNENIRTLKSHVHEEGLNLKQNDKQNNYQLRYRPVQTKTEYICFLCNKKLKSYFAYQKHIKNVHKIK